MLGGFVFPCQEENGGVKRGVEQIELKKCVGSQWEIHHSNVPYITFRI